LDHSGIGEHQRWVVLRHERRRGHDLVAIFLEEIEKRRPDFADAAHLVILAILTSRIWRRRRRLPRAGSCSAAGRRGVRRLKHFPYARKSPRGGSSARQIRGLDLARSLTWARKQLALRQSGQENCDWQGRVDNDGK